MPKVWGLILYIIVAILFINFASLQSFGQKEMFVGFEDGERYNSHFNKSNCEIIESKEGNGSWTLEMPINSKESSSVFICVCGNGGDISFNYTQPSTIADLLFYEVGDPKPTKCPRSADLILSPLISIDPGMQKLIWEYKFRKNTGLARDSNAIMSTAFIDDIRFKGDIEFCDCNMKDPEHPPSKPKVVGPLEVTFGSICNYTDIINNNKAKYLFEWGDGSTCITDYYSANQELKESHAWAKPGIYILKITAIDGNNISSVPQNITVNVNFKKEYIYYPGDDFANKLENSSYTIFYLEKGHYDKIIDIGPNTNNITIKPFPNSNAYDTVIDAGLKGPYCFNLSGTSNISIENILFTQGDINVIIDRCRDITIIGNKFINFKKIGLRILTSSGFAIEDNLLSSDNIKCKGIVMTDSNSTTDCPSKIRNNTFMIPRKSFSILTMNSCGNSIYLGKKVKLFKENIVECLINDTNGQKYTCNNSKKFELDLTKEGIQENFCNTLLLDGGG